MITNLTFFTTMINLITPITTSNNHYLIVVRLMFLLMLSYRAANVRDRDKWAAILDEGFVFTLPITPYRSFQKVGRGEGGGGNQLYCNI